jgi:hypothetical protein
VVVEWPGWVAVPTAGIMVQPVRVGDWTHRDVGRAVVSAASIAGLGGGW